jgi:hypothetical protein
MSAQRTTALRRHHECDAPSQDDLRPPEACGRAPSAPSICVLACRPGAIRSSSRSLRQLAERHLNLAYGIGDNARGRQPTDHSLHGTGSQQRVRAPAAQPASDRHHQRGLRDVAGVATGQRRRALGAHSHRCGDGQDPGETTIRRGHRPGAGGRRLALGCRPVHRQPDAAEAQPGHPHSDCPMAPGGPQSRHGRSWAVQDTTISLCGRRDRRCGRPEAGILRRAGAMGARGAPWCRVSPASTRERATSRASGASGSSALAAARASRATAAPRPRPGAVVVAARSRMSSPAGDPFLRSPLPCTASARYADAAGTFHPDSSCRAATRNPTCERQTAWPPRSNGCGARHERCGPVYQKRALRRVSRAGTPVPR